MDAIRAQRNPDHAPNAHNPPGLGRDQHAGVPRLAEGRHHGLDIAPVHIRGEAEDRFV